MKPVLLLVDDEPHVLKCLRRVLHDMDCDIYTAESAVGALEIIAANKIDLVMSNLGMPHMNGLKFLRKVSAIISIHSEVYPDGVCETGRP